MKTSDNQKIKSTKKPFHVNNQFALPHIRVYSKFVRVKMDITVCVRMLKSIVHRNLTDGQPGIYHMCIFPFIEAHEMKHQRNYHAFEIILYMYICIILSLCVASLTLPSHLAIFIYSYVQYQVPSSNQVRVWVWAADCRKTSTSTWLYFIYLSNGRQLVIIMAFPSRLNRNVANVGRQTQANTALFGRSKWSVQLQYA